MRSILVTGGSRGIGLEFVRQYLMKGFRVYAVSRNPGDSAELQQLIGEYEEQLFVYQVDVGDQKSRHQLFQSLARGTDRLDILINNAGIASGSEKYRYQFGELDQDDLSRSFLINTIAPLMMTEKFFPLLTGGHNPIVVNISSNSGSISKKEGNGSTGYGYSSAKAALNMVTKMLSLQLKDQGIIVVSLHPGWVRTTMLYCDNAPLQPSESVSGMIRVIGSLELKDTGEFLDWRGNELPW
jgi:NAD(P)-dependent dehydrogenase (short-subunit alcohol dehydrogenase family)